MLIKLYSSSIQDANQLRELKFKENRNKDGIFSTQTEGKLWPFIIKPPKDLSTFNIESIYQFERPSQNKVKLNVASRNLSKQKQETSRSQNRKVNKDNKSTK